MWFKLGVAAAVIVGAFYGGVKYERGVQAQRNIIVMQETAAANAALIRAEAARLSAENTVRELERELEDAATASPVVVPSALGVDRVRRLNSPDD